MGVMRRRSFVRLHFWLRDLGFSSAALRDTMTQLVRRFRKCWGRGVLYYAQGGMRRRWLRELTQLARRLRTCWGRDVIHCAQGGRSYLLSIHCVCLLFSRLAPA